jgi:hypothetical protein
VTSLIVIFGLDGRGGGERGQTFTRPTGLCHSFSHFAHSIKQSLYGPKVNIEYIITCQEPEKIIKKDEILKEENSFSPV